MVLWLLLCHVFSMDLLCLISFFQPKFYAACPFGLLLTEVWTLQSEFCIHVACVSDIKTSNTLAEMYQIHQSYIRF